MAQKRITRGQTGLSGNFTFYGKRRAAFLRAVSSWSMGPVFLTLVLTAPAAARTEIGPTSSARINISVSVAPKYGLRSSWSPAQAHVLAGTARFCMATNGQPKALPILLVQSSLGQSMEAAQPLPWCDLGGDAAVKDAQRGPGGTSTLLIVRPE